MTLKLQYSGHWAMGWKVSAFSYNVETLGFYKSAVEKWGGNIWNHRLKSEQLKVNQWAHKCRSVQQSSS